MRPSTPEPTITPEADDLLRVEAATASDALAAVHEQLGSGAEIVAADKVRRGGLWGFFPKEHVQLTVRPSAPSDQDEVRPARSARPDIPSAPTRATADASPASSLPDVLAQLATAEDDAEAGLGEALRRHLGVAIEGEEPLVRESPTRAWAPPAVDGEAPRVRPVVASRPAAAPDVTAPEASVAVDQGLPRDDVEWRGAEGLAWSGRALLRLGLPRGLVDGVLTQRPGDDLAWLDALARVLTPLCRPLPTGESVVAGPRAERLAKAMGLRLIRRSSAPRGPATFATALADTGAGCAWLRSHRGSRWLHLVVGGAGWQGLLFEDPLAVSWVGDEALGDAVRVAHDLGLVLGYHVSASGDLHRATPVDLAIAIRSRLEDRP
jgi:hypothetical protein